MILNKFMSPLVKLNVNRVQAVAKNWAVPGAVFYVSIWAGFFYFTDWRVVVDHIPYYSGQVAKKDK